MSKKHLGEVKIYSAVNNQLTIFHVQEYPSSKSIIQEHSVNLVSQIFFSCVSYRLKNIVVILVMNVFYKAPNNEKAVPAQSFAC